LAHAHALDVTKSTLHGTSRTHHTLAAAVGAGYIDLGQLPVET
jgi:hypothetical protein